MWLYAIILLSTISVPLLLSNDKKLAFYKQWGAILPSIFMVAFFYLAFDIYFTQRGVWGFNPQYHLNFLILNLPVEEWLFFIVIPYASIFLHESVVLYFPKLKLSPSISRTITISVLALVVLTLLFNMGKTYTVYISSLLILALLLALIDKDGVIRSFYITFLIILIPFIAVNSILTGSFFGKEVFWYKSSEILEIRFLTIPIEDFGYAFSLLLFNLLLVSKLRKRFIKNNKPEK